MKDVGEPWTIMGKGPELQLRTAILFYLNILRIACVTNSGQQYFYYLNILRIAWVLNAVRNKLLARVLACVNKEKEYVNKAA